MVVPKRAALIIDRILKEIEAARENNQLVNDWSPVGIKNKIEGGLPCKSSDRLLKHFPMFPDIEAREQ